MCLNLVLYVIGMGDIENFFCNYCDARISRLSQLLFLLKTGYKHVKMFLNVCKNGKNCDYHDIVQLL